MRYTFLNDLWCFVPSGNRLRLLRLPMITYKGPFADYRRPLCHPQGILPVFESVGQGFIPLWRFYRRSAGKAYAERRLAMFLLWYAILVAAPCRGKSGYTEDAAWPGQHYSSMSTSDGRYVYVCGGFSNVGDHRLWRFRSSFAMAGRCFILRLSWRILSSRYCATFAVL